MEDTERGVGVERRGQGRRRGGMTIETVLSSVVVFVATSVDELVVLTTIFAYAERRAAVAQVYVGQLISQAVLPTISVLAAVGIETVSQKGIGLLASFRSSSGYGSSVSNLVLHVCHVCHVVAARGHVHERHQFGGHDDEGRIMSRSSCSRMWQWYM